MAAQDGRRRLSSKTAEQAHKMIQPPDLSHVTILPKAEWLRIQDEANRANKDKDTVREAVKRREVQHLQSKELVKLWTNTEAGQRQKRLEAKKIQAQNEEERKKLIDIEEAKYQEQKRKEAVAKAKTQIYSQTDRVKELHCALLLSEVLKEREVQIEQKKRLKNATKNVDKEFMAMVKSRDDEALRLEQEKTLQKRRAHEALAEKLRMRIEEKVQERERQKLEDKKEGKEIQHINELYQWEQLMENERRAKEKKSLMQAHLEHISNRDILRAAEAQKLQAEEEQRKLFLSTKQKMMKLRNDKETELLREAEALRDRIMDKLTVTQREQTDSEEQRIAKAVAEQEAKEAQQQRHEEEQRAAIIRSIAAHREFMRQEKEKQLKLQQQKDKDVLLAKQEADRIYTEKQQLKAQKMKENGKKIQDFNMNQVAEKCAKQQQLRRDQHALETKNAELLAEEERHFQAYTKNLIDKAVEAERNVIPLNKAAREGFGGGSGPIFSGLRPSYLVQDMTGAQMPNYSSSTTKNIKEMNEAVDIQEGKKRLGFTWQ
ncbi:coiled-coil domain-containing protein 173 [Thalassophryne amazonica]|uniref:coiled-coil domain-containing protein 173 n=1 Tax=Thalassophryne amazonica TaxID=390379 RepID=UPI00147169B1|nr:coiled-coil domain-containing protein 173 [Thalassophryne amazonica]